MNWEGLAFQALDGLASASGLFFVAAGLSLIFGVTRIINIAHGSLYMLGTVHRRHAGDGDRRRARLLGRHRVERRSVVGIIGALIEILLLRRIYSAPELFQLLATFALLLVINDAVLWLWGPEDLLGPRAPGLRGAIEILGRRMPSYDAFLIVIAPIVLGVLHVVFARTRFGRLVRAATEDREMLGALGVNQSVLFTAVFALGSLLAGLGGALQVAREPANLGMDLDGNHRCLRRGGHRRHGLYRRLLCRRRARRRGQGAVHRHRACHLRRIFGEFFQADAGRRVPGHGGRADRPTAGLARASANRRARQWRD